MSQVERTAQLLDTIYDAALAPNDWPEVIEQVALAVGAKGACVINHAPPHFGWIASPSVQKIVEEFVAEGWLRDGSRTAPLIAELYPGFVPETRYRSEEEIAAMPVHRDFLAPRGLSAGVGTVIQGMSDDVVHLSFEGFASHAAARDAVPYLDTLRPHLARALCTSARLSDPRTSMAVETLELVGMPAAVVGCDGRLKAANGVFLTRFGNLMVERRGKLALTDRTLNARLAQALAGSAADLGACSLPVRRAAGPPAALHIVPLRRSGTRLFDTPGVLLIGAEGANQSLPGADLLRQLFDLTASEARLARALLQGMSVAEAAHALEVKETTCRAHLRAVFAKTGVGRQPELVRLLSGLGAPA